MIFFPLVLSLFMYSSVFTMDVLKEELLTPKVRILVGLDGNIGHKKSDSIKSELVTLEQQNHDINSAFEQKIADIAAQINTLQDCMHSKNMILVQKRIHMLRTLEQVWMQIRDIKEKTVELLGAHIECWEKYFAQIKQLSTLFEEKSLYSFCDFQNMITKLSVQQEQMQQILVQKEALYIVISREEYTHANKEREYISIQEKIQEKRKQNDVKDELENLDLEKELISKEQELTQLQLSLYQKQLDFFNSKEMIIQERIGILQEQAKIIRAHLYIDIADVHSYEQKANQQHQIAVSKKNELTKLRQNNVAQKLKEQEELDRLRARFKVKVHTLKHIEDLEFQVHSNSENFASFSVALQYAIVVTYDRMLTNIKVNMSLFDAQNKQAKVTCETIKFLFDVRQGYSKDSATFEKERLLYKQQKQTVINEIKNFKDEMIVTQNNIKELQRLLTHIFKQQEYAKNNEPSGAGATHKKWSETIVLLDQLIKQIEQQHDILIQNNELYEKIIKIQEDTLESLEIILQEFNAVGVWHRSMSAMTWDAIKNIGPNSVSFIKNVGSIISSYFSHMTLQKMGRMLSDVGMGGILIIFFCIFLLFFGYSLLQVFLSTLFKKLMQQKVDTHDSLYLLHQLWLVCIGFFNNVFTLLYLWMICFVYESLFFVPVALLLIFYVYSIIFWIYASQCLLKQFLVINRTFDYSLLAKRLIERFSYVYSFFAISTIVILILRKMFIVIMPHQSSDLPNILLRIYHIVIFISIIFSLDKEEIMNVLPSKSQFWQKFLQLFDRYYWIFLMMLFAFLVLCDPYLGGYATLIWHVCWSLFLSVLIFSGLFVVYTIIKRNSSFLFFTNQDSVGTVSERFDYAKTWYAIYVVGLILFFSFISIVLCAYVWGYGFTYHTLRKIVMYELVKFEINNLGKSTPESFKMWNLFYIILMTFIGVILAYLFKKFVLRRVFDIQYVDPGIQNTVVIISRYVIIIASIMIACIQSKLGFVVTYVSFVGLATFGWSFKDLFTDFVAYFFILVQRPLKLGDYVRIDDQTLGVVRRISPRAVILRRKNSVNIVVPNSTILKNPLYNWNYARTYIGFDDILFCVPFGTDIELVRDICFKILDENNDVLKVPQPFVRLEDFSDKGYVFMIRGFLSSGNTLRQWDIASNVRFALVAELAKANIVIAAPSIKITVKQDSLNQL